jgi:hypothetical protein
VFIHIYQLESKIKGELFLPSPFKKVEEPGKTYSQAALRGLPEEKQGEIGVTNGKNRKSDV